MFKKTKLLFSLTLVFAFSSAHIFATIPESTVNLAQKYGINSEELHSKLKSSEPDRELELIPMTDTKEHSDFYVNLYSDSKNVEHMKYYGTGKLVSSKSAESVFNGRISRMWNQKLPISLAFILKYNGNLAGFIGAGPLTSSNPEIGRVIDKNYAGKGLGTFCAKTVALLLQYLKDQGFYKYTSLVSTSKVDNIASQKSVIKAGFVENPQLVKTEYGTEKKLEYKFS